VTLGTAVTVQPVQHPVAVAEQALLLDQLSTGPVPARHRSRRPLVDLAVFGADPNSYRSDFPEALDLLAALSGGTVRGRGPAFDFPELRVVPEPRTRPRPGVVLAGTSTDTVDLAARRGLPMLLGTHADDAEKTAMTARYATTGSVAGHVSAGMAYMADSDEDGRGRAPGPPARWLGPGMAGYRRADSASHRTRDPRDYAALLCQLHPVGTPERCRRRLADTITRTGVRRFALLVEGTGDPVRTRETIERLGAEVLPALRGPPPAASRMTTIVNYWRVGPAESARKQVRPSWVDCSTWSADGYDAVLCVFGVFFPPDMHAGAAHLLGGCVRATGSRHDLGARLGRTAGGPVRHGRRGGTGRRGRCGGGT
jgi:alkanesulfonate monooxygenase SsuD/methylene tetrahydromethanopterin reductase-like flavin-dependent oxidoreductase (luciferase family)